MSSNGTQHSLADRLILQLDQALHTLVPGSSTASRPSPATQVEDTGMSDAERKAAAGLMRINHTCLLYTSPSPRD